MLNIKSFNDFFYNIVFIYTHNTALHPLYFILCNSVFCKFVIVTRAVIITGYITLNTSKIWQHLLCARIHLLGAEPDYKCPSEETSWWWSALSLSARHRPVMRHRPNWANNETTYKLQHEYQKCKWQLTSSLSYK